MGRKHGFSFSWRRATGHSAAKGRLSRRIGIPLTRSGRQRKVGRAMGCLLPLLVFLLLLAGLAATLPAFAQKRIPKPIPQRNKAQKTDGRKALVIGLKTQEFKPDPLDPLSKLLSTKEEQGLVKVLTDYDKFEDRTRYWTAPVSIRDQFPDDLSVSGYFYYRGRGAGRPIESIGLVFFSKSAKWKYLRDATLTTLVDDERIPLGPPIKRSSEISDSGNPYIDDHLRETLSFRIRYSLLNKIATGKIVEMRLGSTEFQLDREFLTALQRLLKKVEPVAPKHLKRTR